MAGDGEPREIHRAARVVVARAVEDDGRSVVIKAARDRRNDRSSAARLRKEYQTLCELDVPGVVRPIRFDENEVALVLEDAGPVSLSELLRGQLVDLERFFAVAVPLTNVLVGIHQRGIVHRDVNPSNVVLGPDGRVTLVDFELASPVAKLAQAVAPTELEGTLAYLAPEQTGRMNRVVDRRADLYSLGATFYEMLTGAPPFASPDPVEIVHAHLARMPSRPSLVNSAVPETLSGIILKLLAKAPEQRYQSGEALSADLQRAQQQWLTTGRIEPFELGSMDLGREVMFSNCVHGRERELAVLEGVLGGAATGANAVVTIMGPSGVGKTALVKALREPLAARGGRLLSGKVDLRAGNVPYTPMIQAFGGFVRALLLEPAEQRAQWRRRIGGALGANAGVMTELLPSLERLLGQQPPVRKLAPVPAENRLHLSFQAFVGALASAEQPVAVLLDDLQWADRGSLKLLAALATDPEMRGLLLICAFRPLEADHPVMRVLREVAQLGTSVTNLDLAPLNPDGVLALVSDALRSDAQATRALADLVWRRTSGNPLFVRELLRFFQREGLLFRDVERETWNWDLLGMERAGVSDDVADLMVTTLDRLPWETRKVIQIAASLGHRVPLDLLSVVTDASPEAVAGALDPALREMLLAPDLDAPAAAPVYCFAHDRVQQAAYLLLDEKGRKARHLEIGRRLQERLPTTELEERLLSVVDQINSAGDLVSGDERVRVAELNLRAAHKARQAVAYASALAYCQTGIARLPEQSWTTYRELSFRLHQQGAESAYLAGDHALSAELVESTLPHAESVLERSQLHAIRVISETMRAAYAEALRWGLSGLRLFGIEVPDGDLTETIAAERRSVDTLLAALPPGSLLELPLMRGDEDPALMELLSHIVAPCAISRLDLFAVMVLRMVWLTLERGLSSKAAHALSMLAVMRATEDDYAAAHALAGTAVELARRFGDPGEECRTLIMVGNSVTHWREPLRAGVSLLAQAFEQGIRAGELQYAGYAQLLKTICRFASGADLQAVLSECESGLAFNRRSRNAAGVQVLLLCRRTIRCLKGSTQERARLDDGSFEQSAVLASEQGDPFVKATFEVLRLEVAYLFGDLELAWTSAQKGVEGPLKQGMFLGAEQNFYSSLTFTALARGARSSERDMLLERARANQRRLAIWAADCPANFRHKELLVEAELARSSGASLDRCVPLYEEAISSAGREGFLQDEAFASELLGRVYLERGLSQSGHLALDAARTRYARWGASAKVRALDDEFPTLARLRATITAPAIAELDLTSLLRGAAAIASEVGLDRLLDKLIRVCVEAAGAERGVLVLEESGEAFVRVAGSAGSQISLQHTPLARSDEVPRTLIEHVRATREVQVVVNAGVHPGWGRDPYVRARGVKSALAVPLLRQGALVGTYYFENNLLNDAFTPARVQLLEHLSAQIANSLEISMLIAKLSTEIEHRTRTQALLAFVADASAALIGSLDLTETLAKLARQAVPFLAEWCVVDIIDEQGRLCRVGTAHADPAKQVLLGALTRVLPPDWSQYKAWTDVFRTGEPLLISDVTDEILAAATTRAEQAEVLLALGTRSVIAVPMVSRGQILGVITLASARPGNLGTTQLTTAQELARRAATAIENARLYAAAQREVRIRDEFLVVAAHELNTPLASMKFAVESSRHLISPTTSETTRWALSMVDRQVDRLARLIEGFLDVSRIQAGQVELQREPVDLSQLVRAVGDRFRAEAARSGSVLAIRAAGPVVGQWDRSQLDRVLTNLLSNALKFGAGKPIDVVVERDDTQARLTVQDHGIGIASDRVAHIFDRFERGVCAYHYGGLGLGLYIVRGIVDAHRGTVRVQSAPETGSTFIVELPRLAPMRT